MASVSGTLGLLWKLLALDAGLTVPHHRADPRNPDAALFGSAALACYGMREEVGDIDLAVTEDAYCLLRHYGWTETTGENPDHPPFLVYDRLQIVVHAFKGWRVDQPEIDLPLVLRRAVVVNDWPCAPLPLIAHHKATSLRRSRELGLPPVEKHERDLAAIVAHLADVNPIEIQPPAIPAA